MRKTIVITVIVTILAAFTGAVIWLCPGPDDKVDSNSISSSTVFERKDTESDFSSGASGQYALTTNGLVRVD